MKNHIYLTILIIGSSLLFACTKNKNESPFECREITLGESFSAKTGEEWCVPQSDLKMTLGPIIEDGRCNIPGIQCVWEGQFVLGATFENGEAQIDTFYAVKNWRDTLTHGPHTIMLNKIYPLTRTSFEPLDPEDYVFEMVVE